MAEACSLRTTRPAAQLTVVALLVACGGDHTGAASDSGVLVDAAADGGSSAAPHATSEQAVRQTVAESAACQAIRPFWWEIGDAAGVRVSGAVGLGYARTTEMEIASASKWLYATYALEKSGGALADADVPLLNFTSGYASMTRACLGLSVARCNQVNDNEQPGTTDAPGADASARGRFDYNSGHLEFHAEHRAGLGEQTASTLGSEIGAALGEGIALRYVNPLLAGGGVTSAGDYATFLQRLLAGRYQLSSQLGTHATCTLSPEYAALFGETCDAVYSPWWPARSGKVADTPDTSLVQDARYALGHWVEPDGAFSSPGLFGFYPWIDRDKRWYGVIARRQKLDVIDTEHPDGSAYVQSVRCGQALRAAWLDGTPR